MVIREEDVAQRVSVGLQNDSPHFAYTNKLNRHGIVISVDATKVPNHNIMLAYDPTAHATLPDIYPRIPENTHPFAPPPTLGISIPRENTRPLIVAVQTGKTEGYLVKIRELDPGSSLKIAHRRHTAPKPSMQDYRELSLEPGDNISGHATLGRLSISPLTQANSTTNMHAIRLERLSITQRLTIPQDHAPRSAIIFHNTSLQGVKHETLPHQVHPEYYRRPSNTRLIS